MPFVPDTQKRGFVPDDPAPVASKTPQSSFLSQAGSIAPKVAADVLGMPGDLAADVQNLGRAAIGTSAIALGHPEKAPDITPNENLPLTSDWLKSKGRQAGLIAPEPTSAIGKIASGGAELLGGFALPMAGAKKAATAGETLVNTLTPRSGYPRSLKDVLNIGRTAIDDVLGASSDKASRSIPPVNPVDLNTLQGASQSKLADALSLNKTNLEQAAKQSSEAANEQEFALRDLAGVTVKDANTGRPKPIAQTHQDNGRNIQKSVSAEEQRLKAVRQANAKENYGNSRTIAEAKESTPTIDEQVRVGTTQQNGKPEPVYKVTGRRPLTVRDTQAFKDAETKFKTWAEALDKTPESEDLVNTLRLIQNAKTFDAMESIARKLGDDAFRGRTTGYAAKRKQVAREGYDAVRAIQHEFVPEHAEAIAQYKADSEALERFDTNIGKALTENDQTDNWFKVNPEDIPARIFKKPTNYEKYVDALGGDKAAAETAARHFFATDLASKGDLTVKSVEKYLTNNDAVLDKMPAVRQEIIDKVVTRLRASEAKAETAKTSAAALEKQGAGVEKQQQNLRDAFSKYDVAAPENQSKVFDNNISPLLKEVGVSDAQIATARADLDRLNQQIEAAKTAQERVELIRKREMRTRRLLLGAFGVYEAYGHSDHLRQLLQ